MLEILLEEFKGNNFSLDSTSVTISTTFTCDTCLCDSSNEEKLSILQVPPSNSVQSSVEKLLESEHLVNKNMRFCPSCSSNRPTSVDHAIQNSSSFLIVHMKRFVNSDGFIVKDNHHVKCFPEVISIPLFTDGEVSVHKKYRLTATINHSGNLVNGHYWTYVNRGKSWLMCNDRAVCSVSAERLNNTSSYIYFYLVDIN